MFSRLLDEIVDQTETIGKNPPMDRRSLLSLLEKCVKGDGLEIEEISELMNGTIDENNRKLILDFSSAYKRPHDREILLLSPLYFSSICENNCFYCDFSSAEGTRLSYDTFLEELNTLLDLGYGSVELVSGQDSGLYVHGECFHFDQQLFVIDEGLRYFELARRRLDEVGRGVLISNIPPVDLDSLKRLKSAGLDCYLAWLETFKPSQYRRLHDEMGPKAYQAFRVDSFENAIDAGIEHLAGAFLKGLYDWRKEEVVLYLFDSYLKKKNKRGFSIIGTPRLKGSFLQSELVRSFAVSDEDYELNIALDRILFDGILWLQTRESPSLNRRLIDRYGGGIILTLDCSTAPGGYNKPSKAKAQFPVHRQNLRKAVLDLENHDFKVHFSWTAERLAAFHRKGGSKDTCRNSL